jgi:DnaJ family protein A protein 5
MKQSGFVQIQCSCANPNHVHVKSLTLFVRKRDPRYKSNLARQRQLNQTKASGSSRPSGPKSTPRHTTIPNTYVEQEWQKTSTYGLHDDLEWAAAEGEDPEEWQCVACDKSFRSEAAWVSHERSKKHMKEIERLKREMIEENQEFGLPGEAEGEEAGQQGHFDVRTDSEDVFQPPPPESNTVVQAPRDDSDIAVLATPKGPDALEDELISRGQSKMVKKGKKLQPVQPTEDKVLNGGPIERGFASAPQETVSAEPELTKREKRKLREVRKAQAAAEVQQSTVSVGLFICYKVSTCC